MNFVDSIDINRFEKIESLRSTIVYRSYPKIYQKHLIPDDALISLNERWSAESYFTPPVNFYLLRDVFVLSEGLVFTRSGAVVAQTITAHSKEEIESAKSTLAFASESPAGMRSVPRGVLCKKRGASNYGHWVVEMLPKAFLVMTALGITDWPMVVHETEKNMSSIVQQSLEAVGVNKQQIIATNSEATHFGELILVDGLTSHSVFMSPLVMECMEHIAESAPNGSTDSVYAMRAPSVIRDFENEPEIRDVFLDEGYSGIITSELSFLEQVGAFKAARRVIGPMGAALTNSIFCRPGTQVAVFAPATALELFFWHIAEGKRLDYHEVRCEQVGAQQGPLPWDRSLRISAESVKQILLKLRQSRLGTNLPLIGESTESADE